EWHECQTKAAFLYSLSSSDEPIGLFETVRVENAQAAHLNLHIARLNKSAHYLNIQLNKDVAFGAVNDLSTTLDPSLIYRLRIDLAENGQISLKATPITPLKSNLRLLWAKDILTENTVMQSSDQLLQHKVTHRKIYDHAWMKAEELGSFDALFTNELGYVTEGGRSNIFIKKDGQWLTPPCSSGCLPGVMREILLKDPAWGAIEKDITPNDVLNAEQIIFTNALRGIIKIEQ
ncbi:MAG: aminotransferase class IV, partial [Polynucleobacter victoriensis]